MSTGKYARLLRDQYGVVSRAQLRGLGWSGQRIGRAVARGELKRFAGTAVLRSTAHTVTPEALAHGTALWLGQDGILLGRAAAWWWGMLSEPPPVLDFGGPRRRSSPPLGVALHRVYVDVRYRTSHRGLDVLSRPMAALRAASDMEKQRPGSGITFVDRAIQDGLPHQSFPAILARHRFCTGNALGRYIADITADDSESVGERRTAALMSSAGLRGWRQQVWVDCGGRKYRLDFAFERERVAVEFDGFAFHSSPERFSRDRARDDDLEAAGWRIVHLTWQQIHTEPQDVIRRITRALAR